MVLLKQELEEAEAELKAVLAVSGDFLGAEEAKETLGSLYIAS